MTNSNIHIPLGVDALKGDAPSLVFTTQAENSALKDASVDKESKATQRTEMNKIDSIIKSQYGDAVPIGDTTAHLIYQIGESVFQPQAKRNAREKVGLDDPCPCGSGRNYKKCHGLGQAPQFTRKPSKPQAMFDGPRSQALRMNANEGLRPERKTKRIFDELKEKPAENIVFYLSPEGNVTVSGYGIINHSTRKSYVVPSIRVHLKEIFDRLLAEGRLNEGDLIDQFSFIYDLTNLKILRLRRNFDTPEWIPERDPRSIAEIEKFLTDSHAETWRAMYPDALRRELNEKAA